jgi:uncharacterized protein YndB with AHSA1/START domain
MTEFAVDLTRTIAAPRDQVYRALVDPGLLAQWLFPPGAVGGGDVVVEERVGGRHRVEFRGPDGTTQAFDSVIQELVPGERIVLDFAFEGSQPGQRMGDTVLTLTLRDAAGGGTELRLVHTKITLTPPYDGQSVDYGWNGAMNHLESHLREELT